MTAPTKEELRQMMELAAKAHGSIASDGIGGFYDMERDELWDPLLDDGDSRRLEVKLKMRVVIWPAGAEAIGETGASALVRNDEAGCQFAATRLAVLRVAAAIGKEMP